RVRAPAYGRVRGNHAVQLPRDGPVLVLAVRDRNRQHLRAEAERAGAVFIDANSRAGTRGRTPAWRIEPGAWRQGRGQRAAGPPGSCGDFVRRLIPGRQVRLSGSGEVREARPGAG